MHSTKRGATETKSRHEQRTTTKYCPAIGREFEISSANPDVIEAIGELEETRTRSLIALIVVLFLLTGIFFAAVFSVYTTNFGYLGATWSAATAVLTIVLGFYFYPKKKERRSR